MKEKETPKHVNVSGKDSLFEVVDKIDPEMAFILGYLEGTRDTRDIPEEVLKKAGEMVKEYLEKRDK